MTTANVHGVPLLTTANVHGVPLLTADTADLAIVDDLFELRALE